MLETSVDSRGEFAVGCDVTGSCSVACLARPAMLCSSIALIWAAFWMDAAEMTNEQVADFLAATGSVTVVEQKSTTEEFLTAPPAFAQFSSGDTIPERYFTDPRTNPPEPSFLGVRDRVCDRHASVRRVPVMCV